MIVPSTSLSLIYSQSAGLHRSARSGHVHQAQYRGDARHSRARTWPAASRRRRASTPTSPSSTVRRPKACSRNRSSDCRFINLFNQLYNVPVFNGCYGAPVTSGLQSGNAPVHVLDGTLRAARRCGARSSPYLTYPNEPPISFRLYYQVTI